MLSSVFRFSRVQGKAFSLQVSSGVNFLWPTSVAGNVVSRDFSNCHRASISRTNRLQYLYHYRALVVNPDGSTFSIRYPVPRKIIKLPVDISLLPDAARSERLARRKPKTKVSLDDEFEDAKFDRQKYLKLIKKQT